MQQKEKILKKCEFFKIVYGWGEKYGIIADVVHLLNNSIF